MGRTLPAMHVLPLLALLIIAVAAPAGAKDAGPPGASAYPSRPIRMIVAFPPGGTTDLVARLVADRVKDLLAQSVIVENKPGANGAIGADLVAKSDPDGYTLFFSTAGALTINPSLRSDLSYDPVKDFAPVAPVVRNIVLFSAGPALKAETARDLVELARAHPGSITVAVTGVGAISHLGVELLQRAAGIRLQYVPYRGGGQAISDVIGGQVSAMNADLASLVPQLRAGRLRPLAVASNNRSDVLPDTPTWAEVGFPDVIADNWSAVMAPAATPPAIVSRLNAALNAAVGDPEIRARFAANGVSATGGSPDDLAALIAEEMARWRIVVREIGIKPQGP
jgi:tripartite-type tricarboxylate transporter receptor subunit TctC